MRTFILSLSLSIFVGPVFAQEEAPTEEAPVETETPTEEAPAEAVREVPVSEARGLDARVRRLSDRLARAVKALPGDHRDQTFAVLAFSESGEEVSARKLGLVVSDLVLTNLARDHKLALTERGQLAALLEEQSLGALGAIEPSQAAEIGKLAGARALVLGEVSDAGENFQVTARVVDAETGDVLVAESSELPKEELIAFSVDAVVLRSKAGAGFRSLVAPGWGQVYNREPIKALVFGGGTAVLALTTVGVGISASVTEGAYKGFTPEQLGAGATADEVSKTVTGLRESAQAQYTAAAVFAGVTASAWLLTAFEAYLSGTDVDSLDAALARY